MGNSFLSTDVIECSDGNHVCHVNSNCNNTNGSHICTCKEGYTGDVKVNKSSLHYLKQAALNISYRSWKLAHVLETCFHAPLSYFYLITFYTLLMFLDIDECSNGSHDCDVNANCTNTNGSYSCTCEEGYTGKGVMPG